MDVVAQWLALKPLFQSILQNCKHAVLYLAPLRKERDWAKTKVCVWFARQPVGVNMINRFMKNMAKEGGLDITAKNFTNHSVRKTAVRKLKKAGVSSSEIMVITSHKFSRETRITVTPLTRNMTKVYVSCITSRCSVSC